MSNLEKTNFWSQKIDWAFQGTAQSILHEKEETRKQSIAETSCGQGSCNCGGGCNGECGSCH